MSTSAPTSIDASAQPGRAEVNLSNKPSPHSLKNRLARVFWGVVQLSIFRYSPPKAYAWRRMLLRMFGARIGSGVRVGRRLRVWGPWNLVVHDGASIGDYCDLYSVDHIEIGRNTHIDIACYLCGATHDHTHPRFPLTPAPIVLKDDVWLESDCFVGPGVTIGRGAVLRARTSAFKDLAPDLMYLGSPARPVGPADGPFDPFAGATPVTSREDSMNIPAAHDARPQVDISHARSAFSARHRLMRAVWNVVWVVLFRPSPRPLHKWRNLLLRLFGARISPKARVYPRAKVWAPWNLVMEDYATLADDVDCYCVDTISVGKHSVISQYTYLCGATHDYQHPSRPLVPLPVTIGSQCWIAADVFVAPGVSIGEGSVVGARSAVFRDLPAWKVCVGTPARPIGDRILGDLSPHKNLPKGERPEDAHSTEGASA
ncbi:MAG: hypothetical protein RBS39_08155 [Phycisphaerales bacterium]|jgi:putative colanic acid biosynthesis acetyltransferase WcaF|nr:hypothetical protein [Phycisphaerales bacterium]